MGAREKPRNRAAPVRGARSVGWPPVAHQSTPSTSFAVRNPERSGKAHHVLDAGIAQAALDAADVGLVEVCSFRQALLRQPLAFALLPQAESEVRRGSDRVLA